VKLEKKEPRTSAPAPRRRTTARAVSGLPRMGTPKPTVTTSRVVVDWRRVKREKPRT